MLGLGHQGLLQPQIVSVRLHFYRVPSAQTLEEKPLCFQSTQSLYSISRARVQYLGATIPLFKFKHSLFEALISAIHEREINPNFDEDTGYGEIKTLL